MWVMAEYNPGTNTIYNDTYIQYPDYVSALDGMMTTFKELISDTGSFEFEWDGQNQPKRAFMFDKDQEEGFVIFNHNLTLN